MLFYSGLKWFGEVFHFYCLLNYRETGVEESECVADCQVGIKLQVYRDRNLLDIVMTHNLLLSVPVKEF